MRYNRVREQYYSRNIPLEHISSTIIIMELEKDFLKGRSLREILNSYIKERDRAAYCLVADGELFGMNNFRAMARYKEIVLEINPTAEIMVHRMGSDIDFSLKDRLSIPQDKTDGSEFVKRKGNRAEYTTDIRADLVEE